MDSGGERWSKALHGLRRSLDDRRAYQQAPHNLGSVGEETRMILYVQSRAVIGKDIALQRSCSFGEAVLRRSHSTNIVRCAPGITCAGRVPEDGEMPRGIVGEVVPHQMLRGGDTSMTSVILGICA